MCRSRRGRSRIPRTDGRSRPCVRRSGRTRARCRGTGSRAVRCASSMLKPTGQSSAFLAAAVRSLHQAGAAAGDDAPAFFAEPSGLPRGVSYDVLLLDARAEPKSATAGRSMRSDLLEAIRTLGDLRNRGVDRRRAPGRGSSCRLPQNDLAAGTWRSSRGSAPRPFQVERVRREGEPAATAEAEPTRRAPDAPPSKIPKGSRLNRLMKKPEYASA